MSMTNCPHCDKPLRMFCFLQKAACEEHGTVWVSQAVRAKDEICRLQAEVNTLRSCIIAPKASP